MLHLLTLVVPLLAQPQEGDWPDPVTGHWNAWVAAQGQRFPFGLEIERDGDAWKAWILNASERIEVKRVGWEGKQFVLHLDPYDSVVRAYVVNQGERLKGMWERYRGPGRFTRMEFSAIVGEPQRFAVHLREPLGTRKEHVGRWSVEFSGSDDPAVAIFDTMEDGRTQGTFLTTLGDYRFLEGVFDGSNLFLSCFDGAHAFYFDATLQPDGRLMGNFYSRDTWHETWTAQKDPDAALPDPFELTAWTGAIPLSEVRFPDLSGEERALDDPAFAGRARLLVVFGSWCPNCHDESRYLAELHERYADRGLSILGLAFEFGDTFERNAEQVRQYAEHLGLEYPILIAGPSDKAEASKAFPLLDRVRAYPTTVFMDAEGEVKAVYTGFSGPATGEAHERLRERFQTLVEELLGPDEG